MLSRRCKLGRSRLYRCCHTQTKGRCGNKLRVRYGSHDGYVVLRYVCHVAYHTTGAVKCISFGGQPLDDAVTRGVLDVIQPGLEDAVELIVREPRARHGARIMPR